MKMPITVNGEVIDDEVIRKEEDELRPRLREAMPKEDRAAIEKRTREWARENAIERVLLRQAAMNEGEPLPAEVQDDEARLKAETVARLGRLTARLTAKLVPPRAKEVSEFYRKHREEFFAPPLVHAGHIAQKVDEETTAETALQQMGEIRAELEQGADFALVVEKCSDHAGRSGELGYYSQGQVGGEFDAVVFALPPGELSRIFRTPYGYHIVKVFDRRPEGIRPFEEIKGTIEAVLYEQKKQRRVEQYVDSLRAKATIEQ